VDAKKVMFDVSRCLKRQPQCYAVGLSLVWETRVADNFFHDLIRDTSIENIRVFMRKSHQRRQRFIVLRKTAR